MPATYEPIATTTLSSAATTITFSSISGTYTDLRLITRIIAPSNSTPTIQIKFNGTTTGYSETFVAGSGTTASSGRQTNATLNYISEFSLPNSALQLGIIDIFSYAGSTNKTYLVRASQDINGSGGYVSSTVGLWRNTSAITSIEISSDVANGLASNSTATLFGIKAA